MLHPINPLKRRMRSPISLDRVFAASSADVVMTKVMGDEVLVLDRGSGECLQLTKMGARMWTLLHEVRALREVIDALMSEYDVSQEQMTASVADILCELESKGLLEVVGSAGD
ncbi:MAG: PqqD family protein [Dehalococcoidia bacterium]